MAYSLLYNGQIVYCSEMAAANAALLQKDQSQLSLTSAELIAKARCHNDADRAYIVRTIKKNFESVEDMVNIIKAFFTSRELLRLSRQSSSRWSKTTSDSDLGSGAGRMITGFTSLRRNVNKRLRQTSDAAPMNPLGEPLIPHGARSQSFAGAIGTHDKL